MTNFFDMKPTCGKAYNSFNSVCACDVCKSDGTTEKDVKFYNDAASPLDFLKAEVTEILGCSNMEPRDIRRLDYLEQEISRIMNSDY